MKHWVFTFRVEPPTCVVSARNGASVFFAGYARAIRQWFWIFPGGAEAIDEPHMIFVSQEYSDAHKRNDVGRRPTIKLREGKSVQYELGL